ncbi:MAG: recombination-associated protein RdgC [Nitrosomonas sp.]|nr:recombination-associated protein RdgC [Nitrosomonas sp.]
MWFKSLQIYRITGGNITPDQLEDALSKRALQECLQLELQSRGWMWPRDEKENFVHVFGQHMLVALGIEKKLLPATVVNQHAKARIIQIEQQQGYKPGKKQVRDIKESVLIELLPRAFAQRRKTYAWIDPKGKWFVVDTANTNKADELLEVLFQSVDDLTLEPLDTKTSPSAAMTRWLSGDEPPSVFTIDRDCELQGMDDEKATVRYTHHVLDAAETTRHIKAGKKVTKLAMTWGQKISFVLHDNLQLRRIVPLDILKESAETTEELFDSDFALMTGELSQMLPDIVDALGGEDNT